MTMKKILVPVDFSEHAGYALEVAAKLAKDYDYCMVFEAAGFHDEVVVGRKGVGTFFIDIEGIAAHAGNHYSDGADANLEAAYKISQLVALTDLEKQNSDKLKQNIIFFMQ